MWGSYYNIPKAILCLLKGDYSFFQGVAPTQAPCASGPYLAALRPEAFALHGLVGLRVEAVVLSSVVSSTGFGPATSRVTVWFGV